MPLLGAIAEFLEPRCPHQTPSPDYVQFATTCRRVAHLCEVKLLRCKVVFTEEVLEVERDHFEKEQDRHQEELDAERQSLEEEIDLANHYTEEVRQELSGTQQELWAAQCEIRHLYGKLNELGIQGRFVFTG